MDVIKKSNIDTEKSEHFLSYDKKNSKWVSSVPILYNNDINIINIATFNVLFDKYLEKITKFELRYDAIDDCIKDIDADIICLQEITEKNKALILKSSNIKKYYVTDINNEFCDLLILSKLPFSHIKLFKLSKYKYALRCTLLIDNQYVDIYNVHLSANNMRDCIALRKEQLGKIYRFMAHHKTNIIIGDTNLEDGEEPNINNFIDCWNELNIGNGYTYCPSENKLAEQMSNGKTNRRYDRIYISNKKSILQAVEGKVITTKFNNMHPSDHYPLLIKFIKTNKIEDNVTKNTTLAIVPPYHIYHEINNIVKKYMDKYTNFSNCIKLLPEFVPVDKYNNEHRVMIKNIVDKYLPCKMKLVSPKYFIDNNMFTVYFDTDSKEIINMQKELSVVKNSNFKLHNSELDLDKPYLKIVLKIASFANEMDAIKLTKNISGNTYDFMIYSLSYLKLNLDKFINNETYQINSKFNIYTSEQLKEFIKNIPEMNVIVVGSHGTNTENEYSDIDFLISSKNSWIYAKDIIVTYCQDSLIFKNIIPIANKWLNKIKLITIDNIEIELIYLQSNIPIIDIDPSKLNDDDILIYSLYSDMCYMNNILDQNSNYRNYIKYTKQWAKNKRVYGHTFGYPCGISINIMAIKIIMLYSPQTLNEFIVKFKEYYSDYNFKEPIKLNNIPYIKKTKSDDILCIIKPTYNDNTMRTATNTTLNILKNEINYFDNMNYREPKYPITKTLIIGYDDPNILYKIKSLCSTKLHGFIIKMERNNIMCDPDTKWYESENYIQWNMYLNIDTSVWDVCIEFMKKIITDNFVLNESFYIL